jgi:anti-sigma factor RsiW
MLTCDQALELISAKLDNMLTAEESAALEEHLALCPDCRALLADFQAMQAALPGALEAQPPAGLKEDILAAVHAAKVTPLPEKRRERRWRPRAWASLAAVLAVVILGMGVFQQWQPIPAYGAPGAADSAGAAQQAAAAESQPALSDKSAAGTQDTIETDGTAQTAPAALPKDAPAESGAPESLAESSALDNGASGGTGGSAGGDASGESTRSADPLPSATPSVYGALTTPDSQGESTPSVSPQANQVLGVAVPNETAAEEQPQPPYCGVICYPAGSAPQLEGYPSRAEADGTYYFLPAADFALLVQQAAETSQAQVTQEGEDIDPAASTGLVIVLAE